MSDRETVIIGLKRELKTTREKVRELKGQNERWRNVASALRKIAGLDEEKFRNLVEAESLTDLGCARLLSVSDWAFRNQPRHGHRR